jgi:hypothetical protein
VLPLISALFYCRELLFPLYGSTSALTGKAKIVYVFSRHSRETNQFLRSDGSITRHSYFRILALACVDILLTLPVGIITIISQVLDDTHNPLSGFRYPFYFGWSSVHSNWDPVAFPFSTLVNEGFWPAFQFYFSTWVNPVLAIAIFGLFGLTSEARAAYWRGIFTVGNLFGWTRPISKHESALGEIRFGARQISLTEQYV